MTSDPNEANQAAAVQALFDQSAPTEDPNRETRMAARIAGAARPTPLWRRFAMPALGVALMAAAVVGVMIPGPGEGPGALDAVAVEAVEAVEGDQAIEGANAPTYKMDEMDEMEEMEEGAEADALAFFEDEGPFHEAAMGFPTDEDEESGLGDLAEFDLLFGPTSESDWAVYGGYYEELLDDEELWGEAG